MSKPVQSNELDTPLVAALARFDRSSLALAGGKGANLGELLKAGFAVPPGFVITTAAYDFLLKENGLTSQIGEALTRFDPAKPGALTNASQHIRQALQRASIPTQLSAEILSAFRQIDGSGVAVRSSATAEDLPAAAFAGQQETFLNVLGEEALLTAVQACWASLWTERAMIYRLRQNVDQATVKLAVIVQHMVPAEAAGVMFTANPVSSRRDELVIEANPGLGEAVVSGTVTPDHFVMDKHSLAVKAQRIGRRELIVRAKAEGGIEHITTARGEDKMAALPGAALRDLAQLGLRIERYYHTPQDIEWAWVRDGTQAGKLFVLQARPITALPEPVKTSGSMRLVIPMLAEMWPDRPYPLDMTTFSAAVEKAIGNLLVAILGKGAPSPNQAFIEEDSILVSFELPDFHPTPGTFLAPWLALWHTRSYDPSCWQADPLLAEVTRQARALEKRDLTSLTWAQNIETMNEAMSLVACAMKLRERYFPKALLGLGGLWLLLQLAGHGDRFSTLVSGVETKTSETNRALESLASQIRTNPQLYECFTQKDSGELKVSLAQFQVGQVFLECLESFLSQYGHRETSLTISQPAWVDRPEIVLGLLKAMVGKEPRPTNSYRLWRRQRDELLANSILGWSPISKIFLKSLTYARYLFQIREDTHFYATLPQPTIRHAALELGRRLQRAGALTTPQGVFHLRLEELQALGEPWPPREETLVRIRELVARRKAKRQALEKRPFFDTRLPAEQPEQMVGKDVLLSGFPGSPGLASGPARIVRDSSEFGKLQPGDVLVAPLTNPAWTPLFQHAAAVVVDTGGPASHAAIVAREYGVPAVMGTLNGTQKLADGQWVRVDGSRGLVHKAADSSEMALGLSGR